jgi:hypothetical protein
MLDLDRDRGSGDPLLPLRLRDVERGAGHRRHNGSEGAEVAPFLLS